MQELKIDFYSEITCPWCIVAQHVVDKVITDHFPKLATDIENHPMLLMPYCPDEGLRIADLLRSRYGVTEPTLAFAPVEAAARKSGLALDLSYQPFAYPTLAAHTMIRLAKQFGTAHKVAVAVSAAYFLEARNINDPDVLAEIGTGFDFDYTDIKKLVQAPSELEMTRNDAAAVAKLGIRSAPSLILQDGTTIKGCPTPEALIAAVTQAVSMTSGVGSSEGVCTR